MSSGKEKRKLQRFALQLPARIYPVSKDKGGNEISASTINICANGALLAGAEQLPVGSEVELEIVLHLDELEKLQGKKAQMKMSGVVLRSGSEGTAIAFDEKYEIEPLE